MFDFKITDDGELVYDNGTGLVEQTINDDLLRQHCVCRIKSVVGDWFNTSIGANLEEFLGEPNNQDTVNDIIGKIKSSIRDKVPSETDVFIIPKVDRESVSLVTFIKGRVSKTPIVINTTIDIVNGVTITDDIDTQ